VATLLDAVPSGSYLALSHMSSDLLDRQTQDGVEDVVDRRIQQQLTTRSRDQVARFFEGTDLVEPGLVSAEEWRPQPGAGDPGRSALWCAVGRKR
jgi:hypothetical protein